MYSYRVVSTVKYWQKAVSRGGGRPDYVSDTQNTIRCGGLVEGGENLEGRLRPQGWGVGSVQTYLPAFAAKKRAQPRRTAYSRSGELSGEFTRRYSQVKSADSVSKNLKIFIATHTENYIARYRNREFYLNKNRSDRTDTCSGSCMQNVFFVITVSCWSNRDFEMYQNATRDRKERTDEVLRQILCK